MGDYTVVRLLFDYMEDFGIMLKKIIFLSLLLSVSAQYAMAIMSEQNIALAQKRMTSELTRVYRTRKIVTTCIAGVACAATGYMLYRWLGPTSKNANKADQQDQNVDVDLTGKSKDSAPRNTGDTVGQNTTGHEKPAGSKLGYCKWISSNVKSGVTGAIKFAPTFVVSSIIGGMVTPWTGKSIELLDKFYRPLDWQWMIAERTRVFQLLGSLQSLAAALDPKSNVFDSISHVNVAVSADYTAVTNNAGSMRLGTFGELIQLRSFAQAQLNADRALYEKQFKHVWQLIIDALEHCFGFIAYREMESQANINIFEFDRRQLAIVRNQMFEYTNSVAQQLPALIQETTAEKTGGLLTLIHHYCNYISHHCSTLEMNPIVGN